MTFTDVERSTRPRARSPFAAISIALPVAVTLIAAIAWITLSPQPPSSGGDELERFWWAVQVAALYGYLSLGVMVSATAGLAVGIVSWVRQERRRHFGLAGAIVNAFLILWAAKVLWGL